MKDVSCNICDKTSTENVGAAEALRYEPGKNFNLSKCQNCDLLFVNPQPDEASLSLYYSKNYGPHNPKNLPRNRARNTIMSSVRQFTFSSQSPDNIQKILSLLYNKVAYRSIPFYHPNGKLLDVGSGIGSYLSIMKSLGWKVFGTEANKGAAGQSEKIQGLEIKQGKFEDMDYPDEYFDLITMWHSLEHFKNPRQVLLKVRRILKHGGQLLIGLPNYSSIERKIFGESWNGLEIPIHLFHFSPKSIGQMLMRTEFSNIKIIHTIRPSDMAKSLRNFVKDHFHCNIHPFLNPFLYILSSPLTLLLAPLKQSSIMVVSANKAP